MMTGALGRVWAIALNTFREAIRNKVLWGIAVLVVGAMSMAMVLGQMSLHEEERVARDTGLSAVSLFGSLIAIVLGVSLLYTEIQKKTIHPILAKPLERHEFVIGKYVGMGITLTLLAGVFALALAGLLAAQGVVFSGPIVKALVLAYCEVMLVAALAVFFSSFSSPFLSGIFTLAIWVLGRWSEDLHYAAAKAKTLWMKAFSQIALRLIPDLHLFSISGGDLDGKPVSVHASFVDWGYVGQSAAYGLAWIVFLLASAAIIFRRRDFV
jgi:ABC-type transport system involved in multi-copper enzyme maturation permease subunit